MTKPNRPLKRKNKKGSGCRMCKPHKGKWAKRLKAKEAGQSIAITRVIKHGEFVDFDHPLALGRVKTDGN